MATELLKWPSHYSVPGENGRLPLAWSTISPEHFVGYLGYLPHLGERVIKTKRHLSNVKL